MGLSEDVNNGAETTERFGAFSPTDAGFANCAACFGGVICKIYVNLKCRYPST